MAKSSINFQKTKANSNEETERQFEANYLLPKEHRKENELWNCGRSDHQVFQDELRKAQRKGGRIPKEENSKWEGVLNLNAEHTMEDVQKVAKHIEKQFNVICTRIAIHRDEGHVNERGIVQYNYHAHVNLVTYKDGQQNWRREHIKDGFKQLQTDVANILKMERGKEGSEAVRLGHRQQRIVSREREQTKEKTIELEKVKEESAYNFREYQQRITGLETENTELKKELHRLNTKVKKGETTVYELEKELQKTQKQLSEALQSKNDSSLVEDIQKEKFVDFKPIPAPKITKQAMEIKTGMFSREKKEVLPLEEANKLIHYANAVSKQNKELHAQNQVLKAENSKLKQAYTNLVAKLKEITRFDKFIDVLDAVKQRFVTSPAKQMDISPDIFGQLRKSTKELDQMEETLVQEAKDPSKTIQDFLNETNIQSHVRKNHNK